MKIIVSCGPSNLPYIQALAKQVVNYLSALKCKLFICNIPEFLIQNLWSKLQQIWVQQSLSRRLWPHEHADSVLQLLSLPEGGDKHSAMQFKLTNM